MKLIVGFSTRKKKTIFNYLIEWFEKTPYSHAFTACNAKVFQANAHGVNIIKMSDFLELNYIIETVEFDLTPKQVQLYKGFVNGCVGKEYSQLQLVLIVLGKYLGIFFHSINGTKKYICSELCADTLSFVLKIHFPAIHDYITPRQLLNYLRSK